MAINKEDPEAPIISTGPSESTTVDCHGSGASTKPACLWVGCSDSRLPSNRILDLAPGEVFIHRNIAKVVASGDLNCLSVIQFAVDVLKLRDIMGARQPSVGEERRRAASPAAASRPS